MKPLAQTYVAVMPDVGRDAIRHFLNNLHEPVIAANDLLQTEFTRAGWTAEHDDQAVHHARRLAVARGMLATAA